MKKLLFSILSLLVVGCVACSASKSNASGDSLDSVSSDVSEAKGESQGILKALGLNGKVKTLTINEEFSYAFDPDGNFIKDSASSTGTVVMESNVPVGSLYLNIENWKWEGLVFYGVPGETNYNMTSYDAQNRPVSALLSVAGMGWTEITDKKVNISYSGSDSHGNYTQIVITDTNGKPVEAMIDNIKLKIEYWPEGATAADLPTKLTEKMAEDLIKRANIKQPAALSKDLKTVVDKDDHSDVTLITYGEVAYVPDIMVSLYEIHEDDSGDSASVVFYFAPVWDGKYDESDLSDPAYMYLARFVFEDGTWKVDDIGWNLVYNRGEYFEGESYKHYHRAYGI